jgi:hypothetical protein
VFPEESYSQHAVPLFPTYCRPRHLGFDPHYARFDFRWRHKILFTTFMTCEIRAKNCAFTDSREYRASPGRARSRRANSRWTMRMDVRGGLASERSLKSSREEIWYGVLLMQILNAPRFSTSVLMKSPSTIWRRFWAVMPCNIKVFGGPIIRVSTVHLTTTLQSST